MNMIPELHAIPERSHRRGGRPQVPPRANASSASSEAPPTTHAEALCADPNVDVVYVMTPDELHAEHTVMAAERGKQVILDKPMGLTLDELRRHHRGR